MNLSKGCIESILGDLSMRQCSCNYFVQVSQEVSKSWIGDSRYLLLSREFESPDKVATRFYLVCRLFVWDGALFSPMFFILADRFNGQTSSVQAGDVLNITSFVIGGQTKKFAILSMYSVVRNFSFILHTPLSIHTVPNDLTPQSFEQYISSINGSLVNYPDLTSIPSFSPQPSSFQSEFRSSMISPTPTPFSDTSFTSKRPYLPSPSSPP